MKLFKMGQRRMTPNSVSVSAFAGFNKSFCQMYLHIDAAHRPDMIDGIFPYF